MIVLAGLIGYLIGSLPTAIWLGWLWGIDLRRDGTGNPGANNARRLGGATLALLILLIEITKGLSAVAVGLLLAEHSGSVVAGLGAVAGNVFNVWFGFQGGKGLGISGGVLLGLWPAVFPVAVVVLALASAMTRSTGIGTLATIGVLGLAALTWERFEISNRWGVDEPALILVVIAGIAAIIGPNHWRDARRRLSSPAAR